MNACRSVWKPTRFVSPARRAILRTIRQAACRSSRAPSAPQRWDLRSVHRPRDRSLQMALGKRERATVGSAFDQVSGARGGIRTLTPLAGPAGLSRLRLPIPPPGRGSRCAAYARRRAEEPGAVSACEQRRANPARELRLRGGWRRSRRRPCRATTSANTRPCSATATTGPPGSRRIVRGAPGRRGGVRNAGTVSPAARVAAPRRRATVAKRTVGARSTLRLDPPAETATNRRRQGGGL